jgi:hypothetical protein
MLLLPVTLNALLLIASWLSQEPVGPPQDSGQQKKVEDSSLISTTATIEAIDSKTRTVTVRGPEGNTFAFKVDDSVRNFEQMKVGDRITVDYFQSVAIEVVKVGTAESGQESVVESAEPGEKPKLATATKTTIVATIEAIDHAAPTITLKDSNGRLTKVKVRHPERLKLVKVGDTLKITFKDAVAVSVGPAPKEAR